MFAKLDIPRTGFDIIDLFREPESDEVEIWLDEEYEDSYLLERWELRQWLRVIGVPGPPGDHVTGRVLLADRLMDVLWNFHYVRYTISQQRITIHEKQENPGDRVTKDGLLARLVRGLTHGGR